MARSTSLSPALNAALADHHAGKLDQAASAYLTQLSAMPAGDPFRADAFYWLGVLRLQQHRAADARACFETALSLRADDSAARLNLGHALQQLGKPAGAEQSFAEASTSDDEEIVSAANAAMGNLAALANRHADALAHFDRALVTLPATALPSTQAKLHDSRGLSLVALSAFEDAEHAHCRALALWPDHPAMHNNLGLAVKAQHRLEDACRHFRDALRIDPDFVPALINLGHGVAMTGDHDQATAPLTRAVRLAPDFAVAHYELANALAGLDRHDDALRHYTRALDIDPTFAPGWQNLAGSRFETGDRTGAMLAVEKALQLDPASAIARFTRSLWWMAAGNYRDGWREYETRLQVWPVEKTFTAPRWDRADIQADISGKTVLLHAEQGLGDTLQFLRFLDPLLTRAGHVVFEVQAPLLPLLSSAAAVRGATGSASNSASYSATRNVTFIEAGTPAPHYDGHLPLASLPLALGMDTRDDIARIPVPYLALPAAENTQSTGIRRSWTQRWLPDKRSLGHSKRRPFRVGLAWSGGNRTGRAHTPDQDQGASAIIDEWEMPHILPFDKRAVPLDALLPLFALHDIEWHVLQTDMTDADRETLMALQPDHPIKFDSTHFADFLDTATVMMQLDHVVSIDTSVAHLAGAMGVPLSVLLPFAADWRWDGTDGAGRPLWYPDALLLRQQLRGDWSDVIRQLAESLAVQASL